MIVADAHHSPFLTAVQGHQNVKDDTVIHSFHGNRHGLQKIAHLLLLLAGDLCNDFQSFLCFAGHDTGYRRGFDALHAVGIGNDNTFYVFNNIVADADGDPIRSCAQNFPGLGSGVGNGDGFGAAHGGDQLFFQNLHIGLIASVGFIHWVFSSFLLRFSCKMSRMVFSVPTIPGEAMRPILRMVSSGVAALIPWILSI